MSWDSGGSSWDEPSIGSGTTSRAAVPKTLSSAPVQWLWIGIGASIAGIALAVFFDRLTTSVVGWILGGTISVLMLGIFNQRDGARLARGWAQPTGGAGWLRYALLAFAALAIGLNAWQIADVLARKEW